MLKKLLDSFLLNVLNGSLDIYNEFSLQHELGIYLRSKLPEYKVEFERNTRFFNIIDTVKHEIDIVVYNDKEKYAIELKFPCNGQYPEQMYSFIKDICFMEQLKNNGFTNTYCLTVVQDHNFYSGKKIDGIYSYFRDGKCLTGLIQKPTGKRNESISLAGKYDIHWDINTIWSYYIIKI